MIKRGEVIGTKFGRLLAIRFTEDKTTSGKPLVECLCDCGVYVLVDQYNLTKGKTKSCGCLRAERVAASRAVPDAGFRGYCSSTK
jgi:hypothetical protein